MLLSITITIIISSSQSTSQYRWMTNVRSTGSLQTTTEREGAAVAAVVVVHLLVVVVARNSWRMMIIIPQTHHWVTYQIFVKRRLFHVRRFVI